MALETVVPSLEESETGMSAFLGSTGKADCSRDVWLTPFNSTEQIILSTCALSLFLGHPPGKQREDTHLALGESG